MGEPALRVEAVTVEEFLRFEGEPGLRYELLGGEIVAMAPAARAHRVIAINVGAALHTRLRSPCLAESEAGILLPWSGHDFLVADLAVSCAPFGAEQWCPDPVLIVEILSPSTEARDRSEKLTMYRRIPTVSDILLVASGAAAIEHYARSGPFWRLYDLGPGDTVRLEGLGVEFPVEEVYAGLSLGEAAEGLAPGPLV